MPAEQPRRTAKSATIRATHLALPRWVVATAGTLVMLATGWCADMTVQVRSIRADLRPLILDNQRRIERLERRTDELTDRLIEVRQ